MLYNVMSYEHVVSSTILTLSYAVVLAGGNIAASTRKEPMSEAAKSLVQLVSQF